MGPGIDWSGSLGQTTIDWLRFGITLGLVTLVALVIVAMICAWVDISEKNSIGLMMCVIALSASTLLVASVQVNQRVEVGDVADEMGYASSDNQSDISPGGISPDFIEAEFISDDLNRVPCTIAIDEEATNVHRASFFTKNSNVNLRVKCDDQEGVK